MGTGDTLTGIIGRRPLGVGARHHHSIVACGPAEDQSANGPWSRSRHRISVSRLLNSTWIANRRIRPSCCILVRSCRAREVL